MNIHFIAIGGAIMHNLAICLKLKGHNVKGSDDIIFDPAKSNLEEQNLLPEEIGFFESNINADIEAVILGMHAKKDNVELLKAIELGIPIYSFPEFIFEQSKDKTRVVIAGSHGKTSTTAMVMHVLRLMEKEFDYLVGASLEGFERSVALTDAPIILLEGDEYLSSPIEPKSKFHFYKPHITMITGIAWDHVNVFPTLESYHATFEEYVANLDEKAKLFYFEEDEVLRAMCETAPCENRSYGTPSYSITEGKTYVDFREEKFALDIFGKHNLQNMEGARLVCEALGIATRSFYQSMQSFGGAARRLQRITTRSGSTAFTDFAHSPSKLEATLKAVCEQFEGRNIVAVMELHTFSSTDPSFLKEFKNTMNPADKAIIYMSEKAFEIKGKQAISDKVVRDNFNNTAIEIARNPSELLELLEPEKADNPVFLLMTSGNYDGIDWKIKL